METILSTQLSIPLSQILTLLSLTTLALVFGYPRLALILNYCFLIRWAYISNMILFTENGVLNIDSVTFPYMGFGFAILLLAAMGLLVYSRE
jgi:hypothetical protein